MKIAFILYDGLTMLDFIGIYDPLTRLPKFIPNLKIDLCACKSVVKDSFGLTLKIDEVNNDLSDYDVIIIPGGFGTRECIKDESFMTWIKTAQNVKTKASICTGSFILGAAGWLKDKKATTHFENYEFLESFGCEVIKERIVEDGSIITSGAVASSLDLGLYLCEKWAGKDTSEWIRGRMDYHG